MSIKSINYEDIISALFDACDLVNDRTEQLSIKLSFITKQDIFSDVLHDRLVCYLSGNDKSLILQLGRALELIEEGMKNLSSSPYLLDMGIEEYNKKFKENLIIPFSALLLFSLNKKFSTNSPIYHFISLINSKLETEDKTPLDQLIRSYIKATLNKLNLTTEEIKEFNISIGKISLKSALKRKTINKMVDNLVSQHETLSKKENTNKNKKNKNKVEEIATCDNELFKSISSILQGMRLAFYFEDYIDKFYFYYFSAKNKEEKINNEHWKSLKNLAIEISRAMRNDKNNRQKKTYKILDMSENLSIRYHSSLLNRYPNKESHILDYLTHNKFNRDNSLSFQTKNIKHKDSMPYCMFEVLIKIHDLDFKSAITEILKIIKSSEKKPNYRMISVYTKIYICLLIKTKPSKIKNNTLTSYIYNIISTEKFKENEIPTRAMSFLNRSSIFSNNPTFSTLINCLHEWNVNLKNELDIEMKKSDEYDINFTSKIEKSLSKIYTALGNTDSVYNEINDKELSKIVKSTLTTNELVDNIIEFIPNMSLYFSLREMAFIYSAMSDRMLIESPSICRFVSWPLNFKKKLLKSISLSEYINDEKNEIAAISK